MWNDKITITYTKWTSLALKTFFLVFSYRKLCKTVILNFCKALIYNIWTNWEYLCIFCEQKKCNQKDKKKQYIITDDWWLEAPFGTLI